jgi:hypothetical protein
MASRREFLQGAIAASVLPITSGVAAASPTMPAQARADALRLYKVIFDTRFPGSRAFAERAGKLGAPVHGIKADVTSIWLNDLHSRWQKSPAAIAGVTAPAALFCLERLAWDHGMRAVFHAEHRYAPNGAVQHAVLIGEGLVRAEELSEAGPAWIDQIARLITRYPTDRVTSKGATSAGLPSVVDDDHVVLTSWIIAPVKKA